MLALKILIYASVNRGFSGVASLKLALVIQFSGEHKAKKECHKQIGHPFYIVKSYYFNNSSIFACNSSPRNDTAIISPVEQSTRKLAGIEFTA